MGTPRVILEVPVELTEHTREWPTGTARMLLYDDEARSRKFIEQRAATFASWIPRMLSFDWGSLYCYPIECFLSDKAMERFLSSGPFEREPTRIAQSHWLVHCEAPDSLRYIMIKNHSNQVAFFRSKSRELARQLVEGGAKGDLRSREGFEGPLLRAASPRSCFVFYSHAHDCLELLGAEELVLRHCFQSFWEHRQLWTRGRTAPQKA